MAGGRARHHHEIGEFRPVPLRVAENLVIFGPAPDQQLALQIANLAQDRRFHADDRRQRGGARPNDQRLVGIVGQDAVSKFVKIGKIKVRRHRAIEIFPVHMAATVPGRRGAGILPDRLDGAGLDLVVQRILGQRDLEFAQRDIGALGRNQPFMDKACGAVRGAHREQHPQPLENRRQQQKSGKADQQHIGDADIAQEPVAPAHGLRLRRGLRLPQQRIDAVAGQNRALDRRVRGVLIEMDRQPRRRPGLRRCRLDRADGGQQNDRPHDRSQRDQRRNQKCTDSFHLQERLAVPLDQSWINRREAPRDGCDVREPTRISQTDTATGP